MQYANERACIYIKFKIVYKLIIKHISIKLLITVILITMHI